MNELKKLADELRAIPWGGNQNKTRELADSIEALSQTHVLVEKSTLKPIGWGLGAMNEEGMFKQITSDRKAMEHWASYGGITITPLFSTEALLRAAEGGEQ